MKTETFTHPDGTTSYYRFEDRPLDENGQVTRFPQPPAATEFPPRDIGWWSRTGPVKEVLRLEDLPVHAVSYTIHGLTVRSAIGQVETARWYHPVDSDAMAHFGPQPDRGVDYRTDSRARDQNQWEKRDTPSKLCGCGCGYIANRETRSAEGCYNQGSMDYDAGQWSCRIPHWNVTGPELWKLMNSGAAND